MTDRVSEMLEALDRPKIAVFPTPVDTAYEEFVKKPRPKRKRGNGYRKQTAEDIAADIEFNRQCRIHEQMFPELHTEACASLIAAIIFRQLCDASGSNKDDYNAEWNTGVARHWLKSKDCEFYCDLIGVDFPSVSNMSVKIENGEELLKYSTQGFL